MAVEKARLGLGYEELETSRILFEDALNRLIEAFKSCPKEVLKKRLKKHADEVRWPEECAPKT